MAVVAKVKRPFLDAFLPRLWEYGTLQCLQDFWLETPIAMPVGDLGAIAEMISQMVDPFVPAGEKIVTEAAARMELALCILPSFHGRAEGASSVQQSQMLDKMVLPEECSF